MKLRLHYKPSPLEIDLTGYSFEVLTLQQKTSTTPESEILKEAINLFYLKGLLTLSKKLIVIVNDRQRPTPTAKILKFIYPTIATKDPHFIVACGTHGPPTEDELSIIFGDLLTEVKDKIHIHRGQITKCIPILHSKDGFDFEISEQVLNSDRIITINSVEPHYFAGFTGGRKSFLPGVASYQTTVENHKMSLLPESKTLALKGNPVHENMMECVHWMNEHYLIYSIQAVLNADKSLYSVYAGDIEESFYAAVADAKKLYTRPFKKRGDIVITVATSPQDERLYQSFKALDNGSLALKKDGVLILVASCEKGIGSDEFTERIAHFHTPQDVLNSREFTLKNYKLGYQRILRLARWAKDGKLFIVTDMNTEIVKKLFFHPFNSINDAIKEAKKLTNPNPHIIVIPDGILTVPLQKECK